MFVHDVLVHAVPELYLSVLSPFIMTKRRGKSAYCTTNECDVAVVVVVKISGYVCKVNPFIHSKVFLVDLCPEGSVFGAENATTK